MTVPSGEVTVLMSWPRFVEAGRVNLMTAGTAKTNRSRTVAIHRSGDAVPRAQAHHRSSPPWRDLAASASLLVRIRMLVPSDAACSSGASANTRLVERHVEALLRRSEGATLGRWLAALPAEAVRARARLCLAQAVAAGISGRLEAVEPLLADAERAFTVSGDEPHEPSVGRALSVLANVPASIAFL